MKYLYYNIYIIFSLLTIIIFSFITIPTFFVISLLSNDLKNFLSDYLEFTIELLNTILITYKSNTNDLKNK